ncbi:TonB-dependent receptor plug domain-containing protein [Hydrogenimonas sp. SS33]|uniref:TonB-dependent receptor plug domain-containing protein n=1 Tax=Hydrogenimonas leucolamina TaxID=2954236 RepID=UPI00336BCFAC
MKHAGTFLRRRIAVSAVLFLYIAVAAAAGSLDTLLEEYRSESELSKITKRESAGIYDIFTREDLEQMQAKSLQDVLKTLTLFTYSRTPNASHLLQKASVGYIPTEIVRLYINDHELSSASFGSAMFIWGEMPIEFIDHIEIYRATSSIEFGNEPGMLVIKLYTKRPEREEGGKMRLLADERGSLQGNLYYAHTNEKGFSMFFFGEGERLRNKTYENRGRRLSSDLDNHLFYANLFYDGLRIEAGDYGKSSDPFLGRNTGYYAPRGGGLETEHRYLHITKKWNGWKLQASYDNLDYERSYKEEKIYAGAAGYVNDYFNRFRDQLYSIVVEKRWKWRDHALMGGVFYKRKNYDNDGDFVRDDGRRRESSASIGLNLYSVYLEDRWRIFQGGELLFSLKSDHYDYNRADIDDSTEWIARAGFLWYGPQWYFKAFAVHNYVPIAFYRLYDPDNIPVLGANGSLKMPEMRAFTSEIGFKEGAHHLYMRFGYAASKDAVKYHVAEHRFFNAGENDFRRIGLNYAYQKNHAHRYRIGWYVAENSKDVELSPRAGVVAHAFDRFGDWEVYNEWNWRSGYTYYGKKVDDSLEYTAAVKYKINDDLHIGLRAEDIFNDGYRQAYRGFPYAVPVIDRKIWLNLEYTF